MAVTENLLFYNLCENFTFNLDNYQNFKIKSINDFNLNPIDFQKIDNYEDCT